MDLIQKVGLSETIMHMKYQLTRVKAFAFEHFSSASLRENVPSAIVLPAHYSESRKSN